MMKIYLLSLSLHLFFPLIVLNVFRKHEAQIYSSSSSSSSSHSSSSCSSSYIAIVTMMMVVVVAEVLHIVERETGLFATGAPQETGVS